MVKTPPNFHPAIEHNDKRNTLFTHLPKTKHASKLTVMQILSNLIYRHNKTALFAVLLRTVSL